MSNDVFWSPSLFNLCLLEEQARFRSESFSEHDQSFTKTYVCCATGMSVTGRVVAVHQYDAIPTEGFGRNHC